MGLRIYRQQFFSASTLPFSAEKKQLASRYSYSLSKNKEFRETATVYLYIHRYIHV